MRVENATVVSLQYTLHGEDNEVLDSIPSDDPLLYLHGAGNIIVGLEDGLEGLNKGDAFDLTIEPRFGYGLRNPMLVTNMEKNRFPGAQSLEIGEVFTIDSPQGGRLIRILEIHEDTIKVDGNHALAGQTLRYVGKVLDVREATEDELGNGYVRESGV